jgi:aminoglycoside phosphotransferase family enzyme/predicted kinase
MRATVRTDDTSGAANPLSGLDRQSALVAALRDPAAFGPDCRSVEVIETHISHVFLTGRYAYKIKKAIKLPFLDCSTLEARRRFCDQELLLNRRTAPSLYLDVVPIVEGAGRCVVGGQGAPVEWAVRMRQFPEDALLSSMLERGVLTTGHIDSLANSVAAFHASLPRGGPEIQFGRPHDALRLALDNFSEIGPFLANPAERERLDALREWTIGEFAAREALMTERTQDGFVRECHGDLHLANVALDDGEATPFDCIEFDPAMRWSDVMSDVAFAAMDLRARGRPDFARRFVNRYLEITGDYGGVPVLSYYLVYRAIVRAKIACVRAGQAQSAAAASRNEALRYLDLASDLARPRRRAIVLMHGFAGCGKTSLSQALIEQVDLMRIRMDVERKRQHGVGAQARTGSGIESGLYAPDVSHAAYGHVAALTEVAVKAGQAILVDAAFLRRWQRDLFRTLAKRCDAAFVIVDLPASERVLRRRVTQRSCQSGDASEADLRVLEHQLATHDPLGPDEWPFVVTFDADRPLVATTASEHWQELAMSIGAPSTSVPPNVRRKMAAAPGIEEKVAFLSRPSSYPGGASGVDVIETHLSWVFLTDVHAWKLKKPVRFDGLDYRSLDARHRNGFEEIRLNRRLSTNVYLGLTRLAVGGHGRLALDGQGEVADWLVKMRRLPADRMLDVLIRAGSPCRREIAAVMVVLLRFYSQAPVASMSSGEYRSQLNVSIAVTGKALCVPHYGLPFEDIAFITARQHRYLESHATALDARVRHGRIIEGHGDLRPEHICVEDEPQIIDCLEFSQRLRIQDSADELAFLALECERLGAPSLRESIFAAYAHHGGDTLPDDLVDFYQSYRALVRARIAIRHLDDAAVRDPAKWMTHALDYLRRARNHIERCA